MQRTTTTLVTFVGVIGLVCGCSGNHPTQPTPTTMETPAAAGISLIGSKPASGGETFVTDGGALFPELEVTFSVRYDTALPDAKVEVELFDAGGANCWFTFIDQSIPANLAQRVTTSGVWVAGYPVAGTCGAYPQHIGSVRATVLTLREPEINGHLQRTDYLTQSFPVSYTIQRYPPPPTNSAPSPPSISSLSWRDGANIPTCCDPPLPDDPIYASCTVRETDGAAVTVSLMLTWDGVTPQSSTYTFPAGASSSAEGATLGLSSAAPKVPHPHATLVCVGSNARGDTVQKSTDIGTPPT